jgi:hypothetical protein
MSDSAVQSVDQETDTSSASSSSLSVGVPAGLLVLVAALALFLSRCRRVDGFLMRHRGLCSGSIGRFVLADMLVYFVLFAALVMAVVWCVSVPGGFRIRLRALSVCVAAHGTGAADCMGRAGV